MSELKKDDKSKDFFSSPEILDNYSFLHDIGVFNHIDALEKEIQNYKNLLAGALVMLVLMVWILIGNLPAMKHTGIPATWLYMRGLWILYALIMVAWAVTLLMPLDENLAPARIAAWALVVVTCLTLLATAYNDTAFLHRVLADKWSSDQGLGILSVLLNLYYVPGRVLYIILAYTFYPRKGSPTNVQTAPVTPSAPPSLPPPPPPENRAA